MRFLIDSAFSGITVAMKWIALAALAAVMLAGHANAPPLCGNFGTPCCSAPNPACLDPAFACSSSGTCLFADGHGCDTNSSCASGFCQFPDPVPRGTCVTRNPAPAVSDYTVVFIGTVLLMLGLWSVQRVARRR